MDARNAGSRSRPYHSRSSSPNGITRAIGWPSRSRITSSPSAVRTTSPHGVSSVQFIVFMTAPSASRRLFFEDAEDRDHRRLVGYVIIHAKVVDPKAEVTPEWLGHRFDPATAF